MFQKTLNILTVVWLLEGYVQLDRREAVALLRQLIDNSLAQPSIVSIERNKRGTFNLIIKGDCNLQAIKQFISERKLVLEENNDTGYCTIYSP